MERTLENLNYYLFQSKILSKCLLGARRSLVLVLRAMSSVHFLQVTRSFTHHKALLIFEVEELSEVRKDTTLPSDHPGHCVTLLTEHLLPYIWKSGPDDTSRALNVTTGYVY